jgi:xanthine phosphoribosyltransferase
MSEALKEAIRERGRIEGDLVLVDTFLNHRVDPVLLREVASWLSDRLGASDAVVTSEASGIAPALIVAELRGIPMVFA